MVLISWANAALYSDQEQAGQVAVHLALQLERAPRRRHHQPLRVGRQFGGGDLPCHFLPRGSAACA
jgi:hypothetical protein